MAVAAWLVWRQRAARHGAMAAYGAQLALNLAWAPTFFGMYPMIGTAALWLALLIITALFVGVSVTVLRFGPLSRTAGALMLPYISWIIFSASLNLYAATTMIRASAVAAISSYRWLGIPIAVAGAVLLALGTLFQHKAVEDQGAAPGRAAGSMGGGRLQALLRKPVGGRDSDARRGNTPAADEPEVFSPDRGCSLSARSPWL